MNISKYEQRVLHVLAQGGEITFERLPNGKVGAIRCITRDGHVLSDCTKSVFDRLKKRKFIKSTGGRPYRATRLALLCVASQLDNR